VPPVPLAERLVEVVADRGEGQTPRYRCGSGCLVAGRTVLTAAHVVVGAVGVMVRGPDKVAHLAMTDPLFIGDADGPGPDLALIEVIDGGVAVPAMGLAAVERYSPAGDPVERCHVIGYPAFMEREATDGGRFRETVDAVGHVPVLSGLAGGLLSVQVSSAPEPLPPAQVTLGDSPWSGMSGGPVVADGLLLGVVTEHAPRAGSSAITVTPLTALEADPAHPGWGPGVADPGAWWARLGVSGVTMPRRLPALPGRGRPTYWATVQEIRKRTGLLTGRQDELAGIASFAAGDGGYLWLVSEAWAGKTALLAEAVTMLPGDVDMVCYFLSRREADADSLRFLASVVPQLASLLDEDPPAAELHQFRALWRRITERAYAVGRHLLLVVDGLDEDLRPTGLPSVAAQLPAAVGGRAHVLVSSRPNPKLPSDVPAGHPLRQARPVPVRPFSGAQELAVLARQEIDDLLGRDDNGLAADVLGLLTAAAGPLAVRDLAAMTVVAPQSAALTRQIRGLLTASAARSMQTAGLAGGDRYQFAHESLLAHAQDHDDLKDPDYRRRVHLWAERWRTAGWPIPAEGGEGTPRYLLDTYPSTLAHDPQRLAQLAGDIGWVEAAIASTGVDRVLADLRRAAAANPASAVVTAVFAAVAGQAHHLRPPQLLNRTGYILRQLWMQAAELTEFDLAEDIRRRVQSRPGPGLVPVWTTRRASRALSAELGRHGDAVRTVAALADGRVVTGGQHGRVLVWDSAAPGAGPAELGRHDGAIGAVAALSDGRVVSGGHDGRVLVWDPAAPGAGLAELGRHHRLGRHHGGVQAVAVLADGRAVTGGGDDPVLVWDPAEPDANPAELGRDHYGVQAVAALAHGRVVTGGRDGRVLVWNPAEPGADPVELGRHDDAVLAVATLDDGRVVTGGVDQRVLLWDTAATGAGPAELGRHDDAVRAVATLADGRVVTGGQDGRVLVWDPAILAVGPAHGRYYGWVQAVAVLADGRLITGGADRRVLVWDPAQPGADPVELGRHHRAVRAVAALADGRVVTGGADRRVLVWDPAQPGAHPVELGRHHGWVQAVAVLPDGRVVTGGFDGWVLVWDPAQPGTHPVELGRHHYWVQAVAALPDGRVVTGGADQRVLVWDPTQPGTHPVELGRHHYWVQAVAALPDGRVVTGGADQQVLVWDRTGASTAAVQLSCSVTALATTPFGRAISNLAIAHQGSGFSLWSFIDDLHEIRSTG
jgi:WD40 repeat protein